MSVTAKFAFHKTEKHHWKDGAGIVHESTIVYLQAVFDDGIPEHRRFAKATPSGELRMQIDNPAALEYFKPGEKYYLTLDSEDRHKHGGERDETPPSSDANIAA